MSLEDKVGQLFCMNIRDFGDEMLDYMFNIMNVGGVMYRMGEPDRSAAFTEKLHNRSKIPVLIASNLEKGGNDVVLGGTQVASEMGVAATGNVEFAHKLATVCGREAASVGVNWAFAPIVDIDYNFRNPITNTRTFGSNPEVVAEMGCAYVDTIQKHGIAACIKHFPGDGRDERDQHLVSSINDCSCEEWDETYGKVYEACIDAGAMTCMVGHIVQPAYTRCFNPSVRDEDIMPATLSKYTAQIILLLLLIFFAFECEGTFFTVDNLISIVRQVTTMGIAALGISFLMITGNLDFSIGAIYALVGVVTTILYTSFGVNIYLAMLISITMGTLLSCFTCFVSITFKIPRLVTSMAMNMVMSGLAYLISGNKTLYGLPEGIRWLGQGYIWIIPISTLILAVTAFCVAFILKKTYFGRYMFAVGGNPDVARLSGINVHRVNYTASIIAGVLASLSGLISMSRTFCGSPAAGGSLSSDVISAAVLGGVSVMGGTGKTSGLITGVMIMGVLSVGLNMMGMLTNPQNIFKGVMLLLAVILDSRSKRVSALNA